MLHDDKKLRRRGFLMMREKVALGALLVVVAGLCLWGGSRVPVDGRIAAYCNSGAPSGAEGGVDMGELVAVVVVLRHGARNAIHANASSFDCSLSRDSSRVLDTAVVKALDSGEEVLESLRPMTIANNRCAAPGQLVDRGFKQHVALGAHLRRAYPQTEEWEARIRSTNYQRTKASAVGVLSGFLEEQALIIEVYRDRDLDIMLSNENRCPRSTLEAARQADTWVKKKPTEEADVLYSDACERNISPASSGSTLELADEYYCARYTGRDGGATATRLAMTPLLVEILRDLEEAKGSIVPRFRLFSGHDVLIAPLAAALGFFDCKWPPLASRIVLELWRLEQGHSLRVLYNGLDVTEKLRGCEESSCSLASLRDIVHRDLVEPFLDYDAACRAT